MKITIKKSKPIARALIIRGTGKMPMPMGGGHIGSLVKSLMSGGMPKMPRILGDMSMPMDPPEGGDERQRVLSILRSIRAITDELGKLSCGCGPLPSGVEAKIYAAQRDLLTVLGALMGEER